VFSSLHVCRFQFLLGRLETGNKLPIEGPRYVFQFLLGRLETARRFNVILIKTLFQFLLGRLETEFLDHLQLAYACFNSS